MPNNPELIELTPVIIKLGTLLGASLMLERFLYFFNKFLNRLILVKNSIEFQATKDLSKKQESLNEAIEESNLLLLPGADDNDPREIIPNPLTTVNYKESNFDVIKILPSHEINNTDARYNAEVKENRIIKEFWMHILGSLIAIAGCYIFRFSIWDFITDLKPEEYASRNATAILEFIFTGVIIGSGSKPINFLMNFLTKRKIQLVKEEVKEEAKTEMAKTEVSPILSDLPSKTVDLSKAPVSIEEIVGFSYDEGDRPERLEHTHRYSSKIDLVVYHHTCFHSDAPYIELIKEFDRKKWLTGYHCVVFKDGSVRIICRWDRFGNHTIGHNGHSLGLAFQGNFEIDPSVPYSNVNGSKGLSEPSIAQLEAGARVVSLWIRMHAIPVEFHLEKKLINPKGIVPHYSLASKACPGGNFPHQTFHDKINFYLSKWDKSQEFTNALEVFKKKNRVMPKI